MSTEHLAAEIVGLDSLRGVEIRVDVLKSTPLYWKLAVGMKTALGSFCVQDYAEADEGWIVKRYGQPRAPTPTPTPTHALAPGCCCCPRPT